MPLYVVRWQNLSAALVRAANEEQLIDILDEEANPSGCRWAVYDGPLFIDFELAASIKVEPRADGEVDDRAKPLDPARIQIVGVDDLAARNVSVATLRDAGESGDDMIEAVCRFAFPAMASVLWGDEYEVEPAELEKALREDAMFLVEYTWRHSQLHRSTDPVAQLALEMDASPQWIESMRRRAASNDDIDDDDIDSDDIGDISLDDAIGELLQGAADVWAEYGNVDTVRKVLTGVTELLNTFEKLERDDGTD